VKIVFYIAAAVMIAVALAAVLLPLVRRGRQSGRPRSVFALAIAIAFVLPLTAAGLYLLVGTPVALNGVAAQPEPTLTVQQAIDELRNHLAQQPGDLQGWMLLAQTSIVQHDAVGARDAYDHVLKLNVNSAEAMVGWAEADSMLSADHKIEGRALDLLKRAVLLQPDSQRGLWLLGISDFQHGDYRNAASTWRLLQPQLEPGSQVAQAVAQQIAAADARAGRTRRLSASAGLAGTRAQEQIGCRRYAVRLCSCGERPANATGCRQTGRQPATSQRHADRCDGNDASLETIVGAARLRRCTDQP